MCIIRYTNNYQSIVLYHLSVLKQGTQRMSAKKFFSSLLLRGFMGHYCIALLPKGIAFVKGMNIKCDPL